MFCRDKINEAQSKLALYCSRCFNNLKADVREFIESYQLGDDKNPWITESFLKWSSLLPNIQTRMDCLLAYQEELKKVSVEEVDDAIKKKLLRSRIRSVQHLKMIQINTEKPDASPSERCANMSQCTIEALCVASGMVSSTKEFLYCYSEALMIALIYVLKVNELYFVEIYH